MVTLFYLLNNFIDVFLEFDKKNNHLIRIFFMKKFILAIFFLPLMINCSGKNFLKAEQEEKEIVEPGLFSKDAKKGVSITDLFGSDENKTAINVNGYLWRATLNVLSIAPLISTDALGGTVITDWYVNEKIKNKRIKISAYITSSELRSDGISIKVHVQDLINGNWAKTTTNKNLETQIENNILNEARILRVNSLK